MKQPIDYEKDGLFNEPITIFLGLLVGIFAVAATFKWLLS